MNYDKLRNEIRAALSLELKKSYEDIETFLNQIMYFITINANNVKHQTKGNIKESNLFDSFSFNFDGDNFTFVLYNKRTKYKFSIPNTKVY